MGVTQYIGSRYVPVFADPADWNSTRTYEPLTIVLHEGNSYTSKQYVPKGIDISNGDYWAETGNYNAQMESYRQETLKYVNQIKDTIQNISDKSAITSESITSDVVFYNGNYYQIKANSNSANGMDIIALPNYAGYALNLMVIGEISPNDLGYVYEEQNPADKYFERCNTLCKTYSVSMKLQGNYYIQSTVKLDGSVTIHLMNVVFVYSNVANGATFDIVCTKTSAKDYAYTTKLFYGGSMNLVGYGNNMGTGTGNRIGLNLSDAAYTTISNLHILYFDKGITVSDSNNYLMKFTDIRIEYCYSGLYWNAVSNSGEKICLDSCTLGHCYHSVDINSENGNEFNFINTSFDFIQNCVYASTGFMMKLNFNGCHFEGLGHFSTTMPVTSGDEYCTLVYTPAHTTYTSQYNFNGCEFYWWPTDEIVDKYPELKTRVDYLIKSQSSITLFAGCTLHGIKWHSYNVSTGYCPYSLIMGEEDGSEMFIGTPIQTKVPINGQYSTGNTFQHNGNVEDYISLILNEMYIPMPVMCNSVIYKAHKTGEGALTFGNSTNLPITEEEDVTRQYSESSNISRIAVKVDNVGDTVTIEGIWPVQL